MTELQKMVDAAIKDGKTDKEKVNNALRAVSIWYMRDGYFHRCYDIENQIK
mgnify:CR=1 FL=1